MAVNYLRMQATATRLLTENGAAYDVTRKGGVRVVAGKEIHDPDLSFTAVGVRIDYDPKEINGTNILAGDISIHFTSECDLQVGDLVEVDGKPYRVINPHPVKPGPVIICYQSQLRG